MASKKKDEVGKLPEKARAENYEKKVKLNTDFETAINILLKPLPPKIAKK